jgi:hypothetical protein
LLFLRHLHIQIYIYTILYSFSQTTNFPKTKGVLVCGKEIILLAGV